jgi:hypothetical protein
MLKTLLSKTIAIFSMLFSFLLVVSPVITAQNPGGISASLQFWIKGDYSGSKMTFAGGKVSEWINEKSTFKITQGTATKRPIRYDGSSTGLSVDSLNYSAHVTFKAITLDHLTNAAVTPDLLGTAGTTFTVSNQDAGSKSAVTYLSNNLFRYQIKPNFRVQTSNGIAIASPLSNALGYTSDFSSLYNSPKSNARITTSRGFALSLTSRRNATPYGLKDTNKVGFCPGIGAGTFVGANPTNTEYFDGKIAEVIFYNTVLSDADVQKIESYLAVKYGITLNPAGLDATSGYVNSAGTTIYSKGLTGTTYWNNIIGLARDNNSGLLQKQSHQYDDSVRLYSSTLAAANAANTASLVNNTFMMMGSNTGKLCENSTTAAEVPAPLTIRIDREWKLINTGYNMPYSIEFKLAGCIDAALWDVGTKVLLVDDDGNFTNATKVLSGVSGVTIAYNNVTRVFTATIDPALSGGLFPTNGTPKYITPAYNGFAILPLQVLNFTATSTSNGTKLNWSASTETSVDYFEVEKSYDNGSWKNIATVYKNLNGNVSYHFTDAANNNAGNTYYRIRLISSTGAATYSPVKSVSIAAVINIFPNPATEKITVTWAKNNIPDKIKIFSYSGTLVNVPCVINSNTANINIAGLSTGIYILAFTSNNITIYSKLVKK